MAYAAVHRRLRDTRGPAHVHRCVDCGKFADAWSCDHGGELGPNDRLEITADGRRLCYSLDLDAYVPRCRPCHTALDGPRRALGVPVEDCAFVYRAGVSSVDIAKQLGCDPQVVLDALRRQGVSIRRPGVMPRHLRESRDREDVQAALRKLRLIPRPLPE